MPTNLRQFLVSIFLILARRDRHADRHTDNKQTIPAAPASRRMGGAQVLIACNRYEPVVVVDKCCGSNWPYTTSRC